MRSERIFALVVVFFPNREKLGDLIESLKGQVQKVILLNNGVPEGFDLHQYQCVEVLEMGGNIGIGGALNKGFAFLKNLKPEFVVTFDQDSLAAKGQIAELVQAWDAASERGKRKGAIGPAFYDLRKGVTFEYPFFRSNGLAIQRIYDEGQGVVEVDALITSGMVVPYYMYEEAHVFDEQLFIEFVDTEWCFRTLKQGFQHFGCFSTKMKHELSDDAPKKVLGVFVLKYSPFRRYYYFRNIVSMIISTTTPFAYRVRFLAGGVVKFTSIFFIDENPFESAKKALKGIFNGFGLRR
ncbi:glycosyltransferase family 2 protein [Comamonas aquatica]|uniref:glycosyltransferase family 2 protein n=1 Tax=Comamonas aquatica TaxID=225991 RepID=UPI0034D5DE6C